MHTVCFVTDIGRQNLQCLCIRSI